MLRSVVGCCRRFQCSHVTRHVTSVRGYITREWADLDLHPALVQKLHDVNFDKPTLIQARSIPYIVHGRNTICHAETGCGKTFCYLIPLVHRLLTRYENTDTSSAQPVTSSAQPVTSSTQPVTSSAQPEQFLVFAPTPELGHQICDMFELIRPPELGMVRPHLWEGLREGRSYVDKTSPLIITTFSKLRDYNYYELFGHVPTIILDEADVYHTGRLKNLTYRIMGELVDPFRYFKVSKQLHRPKQLVYVAATLNVFQKESGGTNLNQWLRFHDINPVFARTDGTHMTSSNLETYWRYVEEEDFTRGILSEIKNIFCEPDYKFEDSIPEGYSELGDLGVREEEQAVFIPEDLAGIEEDIVNPDKQVLIFLNSAVTVNVLYKNVINYLRQSPNQSVRALARKVYRLSGSLSREEREAVIKRLRKGKVRILIASDIASRGLDIPNLDVVINAQMPVDSVGYLHRAGRTARMGSSGTLLNLLCTYDVPLFNKIQAVAGRDVPNFNDTMKPPVKTSKKPEKVYEETRGFVDRGSPQRQVDPWLKDRPSSFVSKIYRADFEI